MLVVGCFQMGAANFTFRELVNLGDSCVQQYDYFHALQYYQNAQLLSNSLKLQTKIADCYYNRLEYQKCADILKKVGEDSLSHDAYREIVYSYRALKQPGSVSYWGENLIQRFPMDGEMTAVVMNNSCSDEINQPQVAVEIGQTYVKTDSTNLEVLRSLGNAYFLEQKYDSCKITYHTLLNLGDTTANNYYYIGVCWEYQKNLKEAYTYYSRAVEVDQQKHPVFMYRLGVVAQQLGKNEEAIDMLEKAEEKYLPDKILMTIIYNHLAQAYFDSKEYDMALDTWRKSESDGTDPEIEKKIAATEKLIEKMK